MHQAVFADIEIARSGTAAPLVGFAARDIVLELVEARIRALSEIHHLFEDLLLFVAQRLELAIAVVQHPDRAGESKLQGAAGHFQRIFRKSYAAAQHGVDVHLKFGVFGEQHQLLVQNLQAFLGSFVGQGIVDADLQVLEPGAIQPFDALPRKQVAIGDHPGQDSVAAHSGDDAVEIGMQQGLAAALRNDGRSQFRQPVDSPQHLLE